jgi:hypothetical protein
MGRRAGAGRRPFLAARRAVRMTAVRAARHAPRVALLTVLGCAAWRPLPRTDWERAEAHADLFRTRLRVTRLDGERLYIEHPRWTATHLQGVYPVGWPRSPGQDTTVLVARDSIARLDRLESNRGRTALYLLLLGGVAGAAAAAR